MLSKEEAESASILATQNALINLGKHTAKLELEKELRNKKLLTLKNYLLKGKDVFPVGIEYTKKDKSLELYVHFNELQKYLDSVNKFIQLTDFENSEYISEIQKLKNYIETIDYDYKTITLENDNLQNKIEEKEEYWTNRVLKLREKCIQKNLDYEKLQKKNYKILKILYSIILLICIFISVIYYCGFDNCLYIIKYILHNIFNILYFTLFYSYKFIIFIYTILRNYYIIITSFSFIFICYKYLGIKRNFIIIASIIFTNLGNCLYKSI